MPPVESSGPEQLDPSDPYAREGQTFPRLSAGMAQRVAFYGREEALRAGEFVFERGQRSVDFFLVLDGAIEIFDSDEHGMSREVTMLREGQFTGELDLFNDRQILVCGARRRRQPRGPGQARRLPPPGRGRARHRRDHHARLHPAPGRPDPARAGRRGADRPEPRRRHAAAAALPDAATPIRTGCSTPRSDADARRLPRLLPADAATSCRCVICPDGRVLRNPTNARARRRAGLTETLDPDHVYDVAVVGAGPAGLAAAVYAASEGPAHDRAREPGARRPGRDQLARSRTISASRPASPARRSPAARRCRRRSSARASRSRAPSTGLDCAATPVPPATSTTASRCAARAVVIATGARYRKLDLAELRPVRGPGHPLRRHRHGGAAVRGRGGRRRRRRQLGGPSGGVPAAHGAPRPHAGARRGPRRRPCRTTSSSASRRSPHITLHPYTEVTALDGDELPAPASPGPTARPAQSESRPIGNLFVMIGAEPNTEWLDGCLALDDKGFVHDRRATTTASRWPRRSPPPAPASSRSATCARARSSAWPPASARARSWSRRSTSTCDPGVA